MEHCTVFGQEVDRTPGRNLYTMDELEQQGQTGFMSTRQVKGRSLN